MKASKQKRSRIKKETAYGAYSEQLKNQHHMRINMEAELSASPEIKQWKEILASLRPHVSVE